MGDVISYLKWRGDLSIQQSPFNEIDNVIFCAIMYLDFTNIVPTVEETGEVSVAEAVRQYSMEHPMESKTERLLLEVGKSRRFRDMKISKYQDILQGKKQETQFAAMRIQLEKNVFFVVFRGTDNTIIGWKEDFKMGCQVVPAQRYAAVYLEEVMSEDDGIYYVAGHSKGGNLAVYASMMCPVKWKKSIQKIYCNDGPGICPEISVSDEYQQLEGKLVKIVPEFSVVGQLFNRNNQNLIVKSNARNILQHDCMSWQIEGNCFLYADKLSEECMVYNRLFEQWIEKAEIPERERFVDDLFGALQSNGINTVEDLAQGGIEKWEQIVLSMGGVSTESKHVALKFLHTVVEEIRAMDFRTYWKDKQNFFSLVMILLGIFFLSFPDYALRIVGSLFFAGVLGYSAYRIYRFYKMPQKEKKTEKIRILYLVLATIGILCISISRIAEFSTNLVLTVFWIHRGYVQGKNTVLCREKHSGKLWIFFLMDTLISIGLALLSILTAGEIEVGLIVTMGNVMVIAGLWDIGRTFLKKNSDIR